MVLDESDLRLIRRVAREQQLTVSEWVRQTLRASMKRGTVKSPEKKLAALRSATEHAFPAGAIEDMLREIETGYVKDEP